jgi:hypothetical protein
MKTISVQTTQWNDIHWNYRSYHLIRSKRTVTKAYSKLQLQLISTVSQQTKPVIFVEELNPFERKKTLCSFTIIIKYFEFRQSNLRTEQAYLESNRRASLVRLKQKVFQPVGLIFSNRNRYITGKWHKMESNAVSQLQNTFTLFILCLQTELQTLSAPTQAPIYIYIYI